MKVWGLSPRAWLLVALGAGLVLRLGFALAQAGMYCPDEIYQYLEPAWRRLHGFGALTWEYEVGARNWLLPAWYGALMQIGEFFGLHGWKLQRFLGLHDALFSLLLIPAGFRLGRAAGDERLSVLTGCALALFPLFAYLAPHTLSDNHGLLIITWAYALWLEPRPGRPLTVGLLLAAAVAVRYSMLLFLPVIAAGELRDRSRLPRMALGFAAGLAALAVLDTLTWGSPFHSLIAFVRANGGGARWGAAPAWYYLSDSMFRRAGAGVVVLAVAMPFGRKWWLIAGWALPLALLSLLPHKLDRYLLPIWPLFLASGLAGLLALRDRFPRAGAALALLLALVWADAFRATLRQPMRLSAGIFRAQTDVGERADATGLMVDGSGWWSEHDGEPWLKGEVTPWWHGGYLLTGRNLPIAALDGERLPHRLYNYVITGDARNAAMVAAGGFEVAGRYEGGVTLFRRPAR
jgi:GPI mannosyltransferase 3